MTDLFYRAASQSSEYYFGITIYAYYRAASARVQYFRVFI